MNTIKVSLSGSNPNEILDTFQKEFTQNEVERVYLHKLKTNNPFDSFKSEKLDSINILIELANSGAIVWALKSIGSIIIEYIKSSNTAIVIEVNNAKLSVPKNADIEEVKKLVEIFGESLDKSKSINDEVE